MTTQSHYEINVSLNGRHFFATNPRSFLLGDELKVKIAATEIQKRFPESEGFKVTITRWCSSGQSVDF